MNNPNQLSSPSESQRAFEPLHDTEAFTGPARGESEAESGPPVYLADFEAEPLTQEQRAASIAKVAAARMFLPPKK